MPLTPIYIAICDDDRLILDRLCRFCQDTLSLSYELHIWSTASPQELLQNKDPCDIVLLDVQFPGQNGVDVARSLLESNPSCQIIFMSGFLSSVSPVYDVPHLGMVLKDQLEQYLPRFLLHAAETASDAKSSTLQVTVRKGRLDLALARIAAIERIGHWTYFHMADEPASVSIDDKLRTREKLGDLLERIASPRFCRCHISYAVNMEHVQHDLKQSFELRIGHGDKMLIPISRYYNRTAHDAFFRFINSL